MTATDTTAIQPTEKKRRRTEGFAQMLLKITNDLAVSKSLDEALETLVNITTSTIGAERGTIFLNDRDTNELYARVTMETYVREIRMNNSSGVAGWVFSKDQGVIIKDAYDDSRFNREIDDLTGFKTRNILCAPLKTLKGEKIGVTQILNKYKGDFTKQDLDLLQAMTEQASIAIQRNLVVEQIEESRRQELEFLNVVTQVSSELQLGPLLKKIMSTITKMLDAERSTLFINDEKTKELYTEVGEGLGATRIRFPNHLGISGSVFTSGKSINIPHAYADLRFNPEFDKKTGFFTRSILCVPVFNKAGKAIGVTQVLNKKVGTFTKDDEMRLEAFTTQISMGIENAKLFDDVQTMKNYNESILHSMSSGVITLNEDGVIVTCNNASLRIMNIDPVVVLGKSMKEFFAGTNSWLLEKIEITGRSGENQVVFDKELEFGAEKVSCNVNIYPLVSAKKEKIGSMIMIEDISSEKRMKSTMARYMDPGLAEQVMAGGADQLGGVSITPTILFSDIRNFTTLTEEWGPQETVSALNEYFTIMVDLIQHEGGMLDKFIGDAIMAVFGIPFPREDDVDRGLRTAIMMMRELGELNKSRIAKQKHPIDIGIGLNTGHVISGNIGSPKRMDYTVIGDGVNLAARLESACKQYGTHILISEFTFKKSRGTYRTREIDWVVVKGKTQPVSVYEVLDFYTNETFPNIGDVVAHFTNGIEHYRAGNWAAAIGAFERALKANPNDKSSKMYIERCRRLQESPPEAPWTGVWVMDSK